MAAPVGCMNQSLAFCCVIRIDYSMCMVYAWMVLLMGVHWRAKQSRLLFNSFQLS
jgi:hypothetical protein